MDESRIYTIIAFVCVVGLLYYMDKRKNNHRFEEKFVIAYTIISLFGGFLLGLVSVTVSIVFFDLENRLFVLLIISIFGLYLLWKRPREMYHFFVTYKHVEFKIKCSNYFNYKHGNEGGFIF
jgi:hypothetical protein